MRIWQSLLHIYYQNNLHSHSYNHFNFNLHKHWNSQMARYIQSRNIFRVLYTNTLFPTPFYTDTFTTTCGCIHTITFLDIRIFTYTHKPWLFTRTQLPYPKITITHLSTLTLTLYRQTYTFLTYTNSTDSWTCTHTLNYKITNTYFFHICLHIHDLRWLQCNLHVHNYFRFNAQNTPTHISGNI